MTKRRLAPLTLLFALLALFGAGCADGPAGDTAVPSEAAAAMSAQTQSALSILPAGARFLAVADAQALQAGGVFSGRQEPRGPLTGEMGARLKDFFDATGFDPATDVQTVYAAQPQEGAPQLAVAADFDRARFEAQLEGEMSDLFERTTYRGQPLYQGTGARRGSGDGGDNGGGHAFTFALAPGGLILLAPRPEGVRQMIDRLEGGGSASGAGDETLRLAEQVRGRGDSWFVARDLGSALRPASAGDTARHAMPARLRRVASVVRSTAGALSVEGGVASGELLLYTQDGAAPDDLKEALEGLASALSSREALPASQRRALESVEVGRAGEAVRVSFSFPLDQVRAASPADK